MAPWPASAAPLRKGSARRRASPRNARAFVSCSEQDVLRAVERSAAQLIEKFSRPQKDLLLIQRLLIAENVTGGDAYPVLRDRMCCCNTADWQALGRSSPWAGFHDCSVDRPTELFFGNVSMDNASGVFRGDRTIDTDLAWVSPARQLLPWIVDRQSTSFDQDDFYAGAWVRTSGEVWVYYPSFQQIWPGHYLGDLLTGVHDGRRDMLVQATFEERDPERATVWSPPYRDPLGCAPLASAVSPVYLDTQHLGRVRAFADEYVAAIGIDVELSAVEASVSAVAPTPGALSILIDDAGCIVSASQGALGALFAGGAPTAPSEGDGAGCPNATAGAALQELPCRSLESSGTGDWAAVLASIRAAPRGAPASIAASTNVTGVWTPSVVAFHRWSQPSAPPWTSLVVMPQPELARQARPWALPSSLTLSVDLGVAPTATVEFSLENVGPVDLRFQLLSTPDWATLLSPSVMNTSRLGDLVSLPAGARVDYLVRVDASDAHAGTRVASQMEWRLQDDDYPDCSLDALAVMELVMLVEDSRERAALTTARALGTISCLLISAFAFREALKRRRELRRLKRQQDRIEQDKLLIADSLASTMAFPIHLVEVGVFLKLDKLERHEVLRDKKQLSNFGSAEELEEVTFVFVSHQWTADEEPDHMNVQFHVMCRSVGLLANSAKWDHAESYVWVDYCCIPQSHKGMQQLAILSLPVYCSYATAFMVVAPTVPHRDTPQDCNLESYMTRAWCRAEQMSHLVAHGLTAMFVATEQGVFQPEWDFVRPSLCVFHGSLSCCRRKHVDMPVCDREKLVFSLLGVYAKLLRTSCELENLTGQAQQELVQVIHWIEQEGVENVFPSHFVFEHEGGHERRELFGNLALKVRERNLHLKQKVPMFERLGSGLRPVADDPDPEPEEEVHRRSKARRKSTVVGADGRPAEPGVVNLDDLDLEVEPEVISESGRPRFRGWHMSV